MTALLDLDEHTQIGFTEKYQDFKVEKSALSEAMSHW